jgi:hypothetical protein
MMEVGRMDDAAFFDFRLKTFSQLRRASDDVRTALIPALIAQSEPIRDSYFRINRRYFEDDVFLGQMMLRSDVMLFATGIFSRDRTAVRYLSAKNARANVFGPAPANLQRPSVYGR